MLKKVIYKLQTAENIKLPILATFILIVLCTFFITAKSTSNFANSVLQSNISEKFADVSDFYDSEINEQKNIQELINSFMVRNDLVINLLSKERSDFDILQPIYDYLNEHNNITHFYLISTDKKVMYRAHKPERFGDTVDRETLNQASSKLETYSGLEFGALGMFTLRSVTPVYNDHTLVGYIEIGMETSHVVERTETQFHVEIFELFEKSLMLNDTSEKLLQVTGRKSNQHSLNDYVINFNKNISLDEAKIQLIQQSLDVNGVIQQEHIVLNTRDVEDVAGNQVGKLVSILTVSGLKKERDVQLKNITTVYIITLLIGLIIFSLILSFIEGKIRNYVHEKQKSSEIIKQSMIDLQEAQSSLIEKEKLASLGKVVAGVSHEINTPLGIAVTMGSTIKRNVNKFITSLKSGQLRRSELEGFDTDFNEGINVLLPSLDKASNLIQSFKQVAVDQTSDIRREFNLSEVVDEVMMTLHHQIARTKIHCKYQVDKNIKLDSFPGPLGQIITNLFNNAIIHAFDDEKSGEINIEAEATDTHVLIKITDNGKGISGSNLYKIFDPFFTTKLGEGGSGLGLNIIYNMVVGLMGGTINVTSEMGEGACFTVNLPLIAPTKEQ